LNKKNKVFCLPQNAGFPKIFDSGLGALFFFYFWLHDLLQVADAGERVADAGEHSGVDHPWNYARCR
jgi:hypothetical protein